MKGQEVQAIMFSADGGSRWTQARAMDAAEGDGHAEPALHGAHIDPRSPAEAR